MLKELRQSKGVNRFFSKIFKYYEHSFHPSFKKKVISRWSVAGEFSTKLKEGVSFKYYSNCDDQLANSLYYNIEEYSEYQELLLFSALAKNSRVILDIGGNTGIFSVVAGRSQPAARIIGFEPYEVNARRYLKNTGLNDLKNVSLEQVALGSTNGSVTFTVPVTDRICDVLSVDPTFSEKFYQGEMTFKQSEVPALTLDEYVRKNPLGSIDLVKIDVEGYEMEVFKGAKETLAAFSPVIICEIFPDEERIAFYRDFLKPLGYACYLMFHHGLVKAPELINNQDCRNYLFTKNETGKFYYSFNQMDLIVNDLMGK